MKPGRPKIEISSSEDENINAKTSRCASLRLRTALRDDTSVVGIKNVVDDKARAERKIIWLCLLLFGLGMISYQIIHGVVYLNTWPVMVNVQVLYPEEGIEFPAVTVCNFNMFKKSAVLEKYGQEYIDLIEYSYPVGKMNSRDAPPNFTDFGDLDLERFYLDTGHQKGDMIADCSWQGSPCDEDAFISSLTDFGMCHTFNSRREGMPVRRVTRRGSRFGLSLRMDVETHEYMAGPRDAVGIKVLLGHQDAIPRGMAKDLGFAVSPGTYNLAEVTLTEAMNLPMPYGPCGETDLTYVDMYSVMGCVLDCQIDYVVGRCGCKDAYMPGDVPVCTPYQLLYCLNPETEYFVASVQSNCSCPVPCQRLTYTTFLSSAIFPADHVATAIGEELNMSVSYAKENLLDVVVYFEDLKITQTMQTPAYSFESLLSDIGGSMGLFMGVSILTVFELIDVCLKTLSK